MNDINLEKIHKEIWADFYRYRNGAVVESLKRLNHPYKNIFGLLIPQLNDLSKKYPKDLQLSLNLWKMTDCRESRLLALYLLPAESTDKKFIIDMFQDIKTREEADILAFKVLRNHPYATEIYNELQNSQKKNEDLYQYGLIMFQKNLECL